MSLPDHIEATLGEVELTLGPAHASLLREHMLSLRAGLDVQVSQARWEGLKTLFSQTRWLVLMVAGAGGAGTLVGVGSSMLIGQQHADESDVPAALDDAGVLGEE